VATDEKGAAPAKRKNSEALRNGDEEARRLELMLFIISLCSSW